MKHTLLTTAIIAIISTPVLAEEPMKHDMKNMQHDMPMQHDMKNMEDMKDMPMMSMPDKMVSPSVRQVESATVCMMNNKAFDKPQTAINIADKTYYGCCPMCAKKLNANEALREAVDPVSGKTVDKATAIIGADKNDNVYYFENEANLHTHMGH